MKTEKQPTKEKKALSRDQNTYKSIGNVFIKKKKKSFRFKIASIVRSLNFIPLNLKTCTLLRQKISRLLYSELKNSFKADLKSKGATLLIYFYSKTQTTGSCSYSGTI